MIYFFLAIGCFIYAVAIYYFVVQLLHIYHFKFQKLFTWFSIIIFCIPIFCIVDYLHRGNPVLTFLATIGYVLAGFLIYFIFAIVILYVIKWIIQKLMKKKSVLYDTKMLLLSIFTSIVVCIVGIVCAVFPNETTLNFDIGLKQDLKIVAFSDLHYGSTGSMLSFDRMVQITHNEQPDLVFLVGDVFDNRVEKLDHDEFVSYMNRIEAKYGVYAITGNHEFISNSLDEIIQFYEGTKVKLLLDEEVTILNELRLIGRVDYRIANRKRLEKIASDRDLPLIVLDHQPQAYRDAYDQKAFLQLSGHTHNGQIFPGNVFLHFYNLIEYNAPSNGEHTFNDFTLGITKGYGTWGFPYRLTGSSHYYVIHLT